MEERIDTMLNHVYKVHIRNCIRMLHRFNLSDDELFALNNRNLNPRHLIVFDDVTASLKRLQKREVIQDMFYAGRNRFLTIIIGIHDDKLLDSELRKNAHVSIFMTPNIMRMFFKRDCMGVDPEVQVLAQHACAHEESFSSFHKIIYFRDRRASEGPLVRTLAERYEDLTFGSAEFHAFGREVMKHGTARVDNVFTEEYGL
jgi:hypothetical protein